MRTLCSLMLVLAACKGGEPTAPTDTSNPTPEPIDADSDGYGADVDCNDDDPAVHPDATELCNGIDDDCANGIDDGLTFQDWYADADGDGHGTGAATSSCEPVDGAVTAGDDCDDADPHVHPGAAELCNGTDDDCSGTADDGLTFFDYYPDADADGFGDASATPTNACEAPAHTAPNGDDCNDADGAVSPAATELCNGIDDDCSGSADEGVTTPFSVDLDLDGYGTMVDACADPDGAGTELPGDCDDADPHVHPGATELCDGIDSDCSGDTEHLVPADFLEPNDAIAAASPGDSLCLDAGTYGPTVIDKDLTIIGLGSDQVAIDGGSTARALEVTSGVTAVQIRGLTLQNGDAPTGAGLRINDPSGAVSLEEVVISDNHCGASTCAGVGIWFTGELTLTDVHLDDNDADLPGDGNLTGVGIYGDNGTLLMTDSTVIGSDGTCQGSIWIDGGGLHLNEVDAVITDSEIRDNSLHGGQTRAHALGAYGEGLVVLERVRIEGNEAYGDTWPYPAKGAIQLGVNAEIRNTLVVDNHVDAESGTILGNVMTAFSGKTLVIEHSTFANNTAGALDPWGSLLDGNNAIVSYSHVIVANNAGSSVLYTSGTTSFDHTLVSSSGFVPNGFAAGTGNQVEVDPLFVDAAGGDYHLDSGSPAIDAGDASITDPDGTTADLGAYGGPAAN